MRTLLLCLVLLILEWSNVAPGDDDNQRIALPLAETAGKMPVEQALGLMRVGRVR